MESNVLKHHGILGMRWGVRRYQNPDGSLTPAGKKRYGSNPVKSSNSSNNQTKAETQTRKSVKDMTDDELRAIINRMQMERTYAQMTAPQKSAGKKFVDEVLQGAAKQVATKYVAKFMTGGIEKMLNSKDTKEKK